MADMRARFIVGRRPAWALLALLVVLVPCGGGFAASQDRERWDEKYRGEEYIFGTEPIPFLAQSLELLPKGKALDLAMGEGRNGVFLATRGFDVTGLDISGRGLEKARALAARQGVTITTRVVDLQTHELETNAYDLVLCTYYLQRDLFPRMKAALKSGGMVLVETYTLEHRRYRPHFPEAYLLTRNELLEHFKDFTVLRYQFIDDGKAAYASVLARKP